MSYLLDTSFWFALLNAGEKSHSAVFKIAQSIAVRQSREPIITTTPVTTEVAYLVRRDLGLNALASFIESLAEPDYLLVEPTHEDYRRAAVVVRNYSDAYIDFADAVLVAIAERLDIRRVLTLAQRHFRIFRPTHCDAFEILP